VSVIEFNATFNNSSVISWRSVLLVEETGVPGKTTDLQQVTDKLCHIMMNRVVNPITMRSRPRRSLQKYYYAVNNCKSMIMNECLPRYLRQYFSYI
jgi:hypothetical protein